MFLLHLITKVGLWFSVCLCQPQPQADFLSGNGTLNLWVAFLWPHGMQARGCLKDPAFSRGRQAACRLCVLSFSDNGGDGKPWYPDGSQVGLRAVPLLCLVIGGAWVGSRSQASCPLPSGSGLTNGKGRMRLHHWEECPSSWLGGPCCLRPEEVLQSSPFPFP